MVSTTANVGGVTMHKMPAENRGGKEKMEKEESEERPHGSLNDQLVNESQ